LVHFTREIALNNTYLSQFFLDRKVLWMTLEQLLEIFINFQVNMFDCNSNQYGFEQIDPQAMV